MYIICLYLYYLILKYTIINLLFELANKRIILKNLFIYDFILIIFSLNLKF